MFNRVMVCVALVVVAMCVSAANATLFFNETFTYPNGNLVGNDAWTAHSGAGSNPVQVASNAGVLVQGAGLREDVNKPIGSTSSAGQTYYSAFDLVVNGSAPLTSSNYFAHFQTGLTTFRSRIFATADGATGRDYSLGLTVTNNTPIIQWASGFNYGQVLRVVSSYTFTDAAIGTSKLWVNPIQETDPSITDSVVTGGGGSVNIYGLRQSTMPTAPDPSQTIDNLCVADNFLDALNCTPEPGTAGLLALGALGLIRRRR